MNRRQWIVIGGVILAAVVVIVIMMRVIMSRGEEAAPLQEREPFGTAMREPALQPADNETPTGAVVGLLGAMRDWDMGLAAQWATALPEGIFADAYHGVLAPTLARIEFETGAQKIDGDTAMVDVSVSAVDIGAALGDLTADAAGYLLTCSVERSEPVWGDFLRSYVDTMDIDEMLRVKRTATAYLVKDSGGKWRVDMDSPENLEFLNAVTGGLPDVVALLGEVRAVF